MQPNAKDNRIYTASSRRIMLVQSSLGAMYEYMYCSMLASALGLLPVYGGSMSLGARVAMTFTHYALGDGRKYLSKRTFAVGISLLVAMLVCTLSLFVIYPVLISEPPMWILMTVVLSLAFFNNLGRRLTGRRMRRTVGKRAYWGLMAALVFVPAGVAAWLMFAAMPAGKAWQMLVGYLIALLMGGYGLWRERDLLAVEGAPDDIDAQDVERIETELRQVNAYSAYQRVHVIIFIALQMTLVLVYTFIGLSTEALLNCMLLTAICALVMLEGTSFCLRRMRKSFATQMLLLGVCVWGYGLYLFYLGMESATDFWWRYLPLCLCVSGLAISVTSLVSLETYMLDVAEFRLKDRMRGYSQLRAASTELAILAGQMIALIGLAILCLPAGVKDAPDWGDIASTFRPVLIVPPLALVAAALICVIRFPMSNRHFQKLAKWLTLDEDEDNPALKKQLDSVVVKRHKNRFGVKIIVALLRPLYYHKVLGRENLAGYEDGQMVLVCNHGELYGPVVTNLYIPVSFRPWVINTMMDKEAIVEHMYEGTMMRQKWLPEKWKRPLIRLITPIFMWVFNSLEAIPVYRNQPRELMRTFRDTIEAMQAGDNILLFPENDTPAAFGEKGYATEGVGQLYTGFAMIAQLYYAKTKKCAAFIPIYASKRLRTLNIGKGILYDPTVPANEEKQRIVNALMASMEEMYQVELAQTKDEDEK